MPDDREIRDGKYSLQMSANARGSLTYRSSLHLRAIVLAPAFTLAIRMRGARCPQDWRPRSVSPSTKTGHTIDMYNYQAADTTMTLREGLLELQTSIPDFVEGGQDFIDHDILHVLYGLDTSLKSEGMLDALTLFGTDCSFSTYLQLVKRPEAKKLIRDIGYAKILWFLFTSWPVMLAAVFRARRQTKRWNYTNYASRLDVALPVLREEFGICVPAQS